MPHMAVWFEVQTKEIKVHMWDRKLFLITTIIQQNWLYSLIQKSKVINNHKSYICRREGEAGNPVTEKIFYI
jgi:hypothetical protein